MGLNEIVAWYPERDLNPHTLTARDFKSLVSTIPPSGHVLRVASGESRYDLLCVRFFPGHILRAGACNAPRFEAAWRVFGNRAFLFLPFAGAQPENVHGFKIFVQAQQSAAHSLRQQGRNFERNLAVHIQSVRFKNALEHERIAQWRKVQMGRPGPLEQLLNLAGQFFLHFKQCLVCEAVVIAEVGKKFAAVFVHALAYTEKKPFRQ